MGSSDGISGENVKFIICRVKKKKHQQNKPEKNQCTRKSTISPTYTNTLTYKRPSN